jgi:hypothetical protein
MKEKVFLFLILISPCFLFLFGCTQPNLISDTNSNNAAAPSVLQTNTYYYKAAMSNVVPEIIKVDLTGVDAYKAAEYGSHCYYKINPTNQEKESAELATYLSESNCYAEYKIKLDIKGFDSKGNPVKEYSTITKKGIKYAEEREVLNSEVSENNPTHISYFIEDEKVDTPFTLENKKRVCATYLGTEYCNVLPDNAELDKYLNLHPNALNGYVPLGVDGYLYNQLKQNYEQFDLVKKAGYSASGYDQNLSTRTILGVETLCLTIVANSLNSIGITCVNHAGITMYSLMVNDSKDPIAKVEMIATEYSDTVDSSFFDKFLK